MVMQQDVILGLSSYTTLTQLSVHLKQIKFHLSGLKLVENNQTATV